MNTDNEKVFDSSQEGGTNRNDEQKSSSEEGTDRREDSRPYRPRIQRPATSSSSPYDRPQRSSNRYGGDRPSYGRDNREGGYNRENSYNRNNNYNREGGYNRPQNNYNREGNEERSERPYRPRITPAGSENAYRPRYNNSNNSSYGDRPQQDSGYNNRDGERRSYNRNPYQQNSGDGDQRPRFSRPGGYNNNNRDENGYGNRNNNSYGGGHSYGNGDYSQQRRPRFNQGGQGGYGGRSNNFRRPYNNQDGSSYDPNAKYSIKKQIEYKEENTDPDALIRLNKYLANAGVCSRREADTFIQAGVVSVNGEIITELGTKVKRSDDVKFHDTAVSVEHKVYLLLNKPKDCVTTSDDPQARKTVMDFVKGACKERIYPVGRLDRNTTGVLLLTNDGDLASKLTHPKFLKKKVYQVTLDKICQQGDLDHIVSGVSLDDGEIIADAVGFSDEKDRRQVGIEIHSGKNRIVRRIFESLGYKVIKLDRVLFAGLTKKGLRRGEWRYLTEVEVGTLRMGAFE
jgi:23S rRNA pseudouridine2605 synthase